MSNTHLDINILLHILKHVSDFKTCVALMKVGGKECFDAAAKMNYIRVVDLRNLPLKIGVQFKNTKVAMMNIHSLLSAFRILFLKNLCNCTECVAYSRRDHTVPMVYTMPRGRWIDTLIQRSDWYYFLTTNVDNFVDGLKIICETFTLKGVVHCLSNIEFSYDENASKVTLAKIVLKGREILVPIDIIKRPRRFMEFLKHTS